MATFYLDFENGNDANNGTTFANRWKTLTSGATAARIAPGDEIRIMGSPAPTSLGQNGVWTSQALQATKSITGATNATPIAITCAAHGYSTGDTVVVTGVSGNTAANGTWEITSTGANTFTLDGSAGNAAYVSSGTVRLRNNTRVMLTTAVTQNIASTGPGRTAWTSADVNVTTSLDTSVLKEHSVSDAISVGVNFTTGKAAYYTLPATLDLSAYQQVSFGVYITFNAFTTANKCELRLCSDTTGNTVVDTIAFPIVPSVGRMQCITVDKGSALGSSISSIALNVNSDLATAGTVVVYLSNIIACKASSEPDSLTLSSLIGKNVTGETFWGIQSINGRRVMLDADTNAGPASTTVRGYYGTSETVTTWKRETIKLGPATSATTALQTIADSGTDGNPITFSGGWNRTDMSTQSLETWLDGLNGLGRAVDYGISRNWATLTNMAFTRFNNGIIFSSGHNCTADIVASNNNTASATENSIATFTTQTIGHAVANAGNYAIEMANSRGILNLKYGINSNALVGVQGFSDPCYIYGITDSATISNNGSFGVTK